MRKNYILYTVEERTRDFLYVEQLNRTGNIYTVIPVRARRYYFISAVFWSYIRNLRWMDLRYATD